MEKALRLLEEVGPETARRHYQEAVRLFEGHLARHPQDGEARRRQDELRRRFEARPEEDPAGRALAVDHVEAEDLFPALLDRYHRRPAVRLTVRNTDGRPLRDVQAALSVPDYLDFPSESEPVAALEPGASAVLELKVPLNRRALELEESLPVQGQVELSWRGGDAGGEVRRRRVTIGFTLHRRTALRWDDSGRLASFITPNEGVVGTFALRAADASPPAPFRLSARLLRAALVCDALGAYGLRYVEDPDSPLTAALGGRGVVDTVRFPRETLRLRSGDCDDTTALLASLLEAAGIRTAVMTSPGHVFLAFESGESAAWLLEGSDRSVIRHGSSVWIPVETTVLQQGFLRAWQEASRLVREHEGQGRIEFLPLGDLRERYPPIPLAESLLAAAEPEAAQTAALHDRTLGNLLAALHDGPARALEAGLAAARGAEALRLRNRLGILHARFGRDELAERSFQEALEAQPAFLPAACNLANLKLLRGELEAAERVLQRALEHDPQSTAAHLLLAQLHQRRQDPVRAQEHWRVVQRRDPPLAGRYAHLGGGAVAPAADAARAGAAGPELPFVE